MLVLLGRSIICMTDLFSRRPDAYHSCYTLVGLSSTQHRNYVTKKWDTESGYPLDSAFHWASERISAKDEHEEEELFDAEDKLESIHPIYVIPCAAVERCRKLFNQKVGF